MTLPMFHRRSFPQRPRKIWVSKRAEKWIQLLEASRRAAELELEIEQHRAQSRHCKAEIRQHAARQVALNRAQQAGVAFNELELAGLAAGAPENDKGDLDEGEFVEALDPHIWDRRLRQLEPSTSDTR